MKKLVLAITTSILCSGAHAEEQVSQEVQMEYNKYIERFNQEGKARIEKRYLNGIRFCSSRGGVASFESGYKIIAELCSSCTKLRG